MVFSRQGGDPLFLRSSPDPREKVGGGCTRIYDLYSDPSGNPLAPAWRRLGAGLTPTWRRMAPLLWRENEGNEKRESVIIEIPLLGASSSRSQSDPGRGTPRSRTAF